MCSPWDKQHTGNVSTQPLFPPRAVPVPWGLIEFGIDSEMMPVTQGSVVH